jgi:Peptidase family M28
MRRAFRHLAFHFQISLCLLLTLTALAQSADPFTDNFTVSSSIRVALDVVSADSLRGHLSFIASDLLEGRDSPSRGLDIAAEYIAAQFRRAGLEPLGDHGYFQTAHFFLAQQDMRKFSFQIKPEGQILRASPEKVSFRVKSRLEVSTASIFKLEYSDEAISVLNAEGLRNKVVITEIPDFVKEDPSRWAELSRKQQLFLKKLGSFQVPLVISIDRSSTKGDGPGPGRLIDPEERKSPGPPQSVPLVRVCAPQWVKAYDHLAAGDNAVSVALQVPEPTEKPVKLRNVIGLLRGSDPQLKETCVMVTAHYDHVGVKPGAEGDQIYNGANDDGSGTVAVIELAAALSHLSPRPKRSILFMTVFGEEKGLMGSHYYARHPLFPMQSTVANINLEVLGRSDGTEGIERSRASLTGFDYSSVGAVLKRAGSLVGVDVYKHERFSDAFFSRSDNQAFADLGVPAHSLCAVFLYPDYHKASDHWDKIDYPNLERITRTVALGLLMIAENPAEPRWTEGNPKAAKYLKVWQSQQKP